MGFNFQDLVEEKDREITKIRERFADEVARRAAELKGKKIRLKYKRTDGTCGIRTVRVKNLIGKSDGYTDLFQIVTVRDKIHPIFADTDITDITILE